MYDNINTSIQRHKIKFNKYFENLLSSYLSKNELSKAMLYGTSNGGKRIRPYLISIFSNIASLPKKNYYNLSAAIECIHSYSLIHDDLPCMDNDNLRRGKPASHIKFGESTAILSGNSLLTIAFEMITEKNYGIKLNKKILI